MTTTSGRDAPGKGIRPGGGGGCGPGPAPTACTGNCQHHRTNPECVCGHSYNLHNLDRVRKPCDRGAGVPGLTCPCEQYEDASCFCGQPSDRDYVHRAHECVPWVGRDGAS